MAGLIVAYTADLLVFYVHAHPSPSKPELTPWKFSTDTVKICRIKMARQRYNGRSTRREEATTALNMGRTFHSGKPSSTFLSCFVSMIRTHSPDRNRIAHKKGLRRVDAGKTDESTGEESDSSGNRSRSRSHRSSNKRNKDKSSRKRNHGKFGIVVNNKNLHFARAKWSNCQFSYLFS